MSCSKNPMEKIFTDALIIQAVITIAKETNVELSEEAQKMSAKVDSLILDMYEKSDKAEPLHAVQAGILRQVRTMDIADFRVGEDKHNQVVLETNVDVFKHRSIKNMVAFLESCTFSA